MTLGDKISEVNVEENSWKIFLPKVEDSRLIELKVGESLESSQRWNRVHWSTFIRHHIITVSRSPPTKGIISVQKSTEGEECTVSIWYDDLFRDPVG